MEIRRGPTSGGRETWILITLALCLPPLLQAKDVKVITKKLDVTTASFFQNLRPHAQKMPKMSRPGGMRGGWSEEAPLGRMAQIPRKRRGGGGVGERGRFHCMRNESTSQAVCAQFCMRKAYDDGVCEERDGAGTCICHGLNGRSSPVKIFSPRPPKKWASQRKAVLGSGIGKFSCDNSLEAKSICEVFCLSVKNSTESACAEDRKSCLCFSHPSNQKNGRGGGLRGKRTLVDVGLGLGGALQESVVLPSSVGGQMMSRQRQRPRPPFGSMKPRPPFGGQMGLLGCTAFSCVYNCPPRCDSLCTASMQCFCSCAEDEVFYEYDDTPSFYTDSLAFY